MRAYPKHVLQEEIEGGGRGGVYCADIPQSLIELQAWWEDITADFGYPLYAVIIASKSDDEVYAFIENDVEELGQISGKECCFLFFRDEEEARRLTVWDFSEHAKFALPFGQLLGIKRYPSIVFLKSVDRKFFVTYALEGQSQSEIRKNLRELFSRYYSRKEEDRLTRISVIKRNGLVKKVFQEVFNKVEIPGVKFVKAISKPFFQNG